VIDDVVNSYNRSHHRSIGVALIDVTSENEDEIARRQYPPKPPFKYRYDVRDRVRIAKYKTRVPERLPTKLDGDFHDRRQVSDSPRYVRSRGLDGRTYKGVNFMSKRFKK
jgi:hypothetical protein